MTGLTLDAGALIALDKGDRRVVTLLARATERGDRITVPATVLAQVLRTPVRQVRVVRLCRQPGTDLVPLDGPDASAVGRLLGATRTTDLADAHVVICARRAGQVVATSDADDLRRLHPSLVTVDV